MMRSWRQSTTLAAALLAFALPGARAGAPSAQGVAVKAADLNGPLLLQISYERDYRRSFDRFMTSKSRIVTLRRQGDTVAMLEAADDSGPATLLARIPIRSDAAGVLMLDFNAGLDRVFVKEDRTGEDYYGRLDGEDSSYIQLFHRSIRKAFHSGSTLVLEQRATDVHGWPLVVHYYLSPYRPNPGFEPYEMKDLEHFGFYETYPQQRGQQTVFYATKFDIQEPIVFALSRQIPTRHRQAVRDGVLYWNRAFGLPIIHVIDAPKELPAPNPKYNFIEWDADHGRASTSHIQTDPLTGEILHAYVFILPPEEGQDGLSDAYEDRLRYLVAHEIGHALGLRHNFADGPVSTVMNYLSIEDEIRIGRDIIAPRREALAYDRSVIRDVYLNEPLDTATLPAFCTDYQPGCGPRREEAQIAATRASIRARPGGH